MYFRRVLDQTDGKDEREGSASMEKTGWTGQKRMEGWKTVVPLGFMLLGMLLVAVFAASAPGCKGPAPQEAARTEPEMSINEYWQSLFKDDPENQNEFKRIQGEFRMGKHSLAFQDIQELLERSPQAPWTEAVRFYVAQAWTALRQYGNALRQLDSLLIEYPKSPAVPRFLVSKGQIYLAMGKERSSSAPEDPVGESYLQKAKEVFLQASKDYPNNRETDSEALFYLGDVYDSLGEPARAKEVFGKVADVYADTPFGGKSLYALGGLELSEADLEGAEKAFREITDRYPETSLAGKARQKLEGIELVGSQAPPLQVKEWIGEAPPEGGIYRGKLTLLSFWAVWCPHCKRNIPKIEGLLETYATRGVSVVGVTREKEGEGVEKIREFVESHPMDYPTAVDDDGKTSQEMAVKSIPCVVAVDSQGRIRWHGHPDHLSGKVMELLLQPSS
jgi:TolA-binding protein/peroxiredoxin